MRFLFVHPIFPGQFHHMMAGLAADPAHQVWHLSQQSALEAIPGVKKFRYSVPEQPPPANPFLNRFAAAVQQGEATYKALAALKTKGFVPDVVCCYAGWGHGLYLKDVLPRVPVLGYFEWFQNAHGAEYNFDPAHPLGEDHQRLLRVANAGTLLDLQSFDQGLTPTQWQRQQFPQAFHDKLQVIHDGVDTDAYQPARLASLTLPDGVVLEPGKDRIITYCTRGMEPLRGFPQFMRALARVQQADPLCHAVIAGNDQSYYSRALPPGQTYKQLMLQELAGQLDLSRIHFTGWLAPPEYVRLLQASDVHVYLSYPYVLSWSLLQAMSCGCLVVGSRTAPVQEFIRDRDNGLLVDFFDTAELSQAMLEGLAAKDSGALVGVRHQARQTIVDGCALRQVLPRQLDLLGRLGQGGR